MVKKRIGRILYDQDSGDIDQDVLQEKAYPELRQKYNIFVAWEQLELAEEELSYNYDLSGKVFPNYKFKFQAKLIKLFNYMKMMINFKIEELKGIVTLDTSELWKYHRLCFEKMEKLERKKAVYSMDTLYELKNFVIHYMHECNLSNLLRHEEDDLDAFAKEYE